LSWAAAAEIALGGASSAREANNLYSINSAGLQTKLAIQLNTFVRRPANAGAV
jgi:uncharacterized FlgJ-related protein